MLLDWKADECPAWTTSSDSSGASTQPKAASQANAPADLVSSSAAVMAYRTTAFGGRSSAAHSPMAASFTVSASRPDSAVGSAAGKLSKRSSKSMNMPSAMPTRVLLPTRSTSGSSLTSASGADASVALGLVQGLKTHGLLKGVLMRGQNQSMRRARFSRDRQGLQQEAGQNLVMTARQC
ncbi:MAG: hypothetical protein FRX49_06589 [Trebouxia sp. A1-2]|nr:MAG: hypothetical protein FRX49_06589 [Trebouxia sp. A1-2]